MNRFLLLILTIISFQGNAFASEDKIVAIVNKRPITLSELDQRKKIMKFFGNVSNLSAEQEKAFATFKKLTQLTWNQVYRDKGLKWEKIHSIAAPKNIEALYSFRVSKSIRGIGFRENHFLRVLLIEPDHDAAYGKK